MSDTGSTTNFVDEAYIQELAERAREGDNSASIELDYLLGQLMTNQGAGVTGSEDPQVWAHLAGVIQTAKAEVTGTGAYTPYHEISDADLLAYAKQEDPMFAPVGAMTDNERQRYRSMLAEERYAKFREDWAYVMSGGDPTGMDDFSGIQALEGYADQTTGEFVGGFDQMDNRLGDTRNQRGMLPGQNKDDARHRASELDSAGTRLGWMLEDMTKREARGLMLSLAPQELASLQRAMDDAGLYGEAPVFGLLTSDDFAAFDTLSGLSDLAAGQKSMTTILTELQRNNLGSLGEVTGVLSTEEASNRVVSLTSSEALRQMGEEIGLASNGRRPSSAAMDRAIAAVHARERDYHTKRLSGEDINSGLRNPDRESFINALGGLRGFSGGNWAHWSTQLFGAVVEQTPENREAVAHALTQHYFDRYGDWGKVAEAIYHGPERSAFNLAGNIQANRYPNNPVAQAEGRAIGPVPVTAQEYTEAAMTALAEARADRIAGSGDQVGGLTFIEAPDGQAILNRELRAADEVGYQSWQFADAASNFYRLLGSSY